MSTNSSKLNRPMPSMPQAEKILALTNAASVELEPIWATLLANALHGKDIQDMLSNITVVKGTADNFNALSVTAPGTENQDEGPPQDEDEDDDGDLVNIPPAYIHYGCSCHLCL